MLNLIVALFLLPSLQNLSGDLHPPVRLTVAEEPLDVQRIGHAAPFFGDIDGTGRKDLLVGQFHEGRLRIYRNVGKNALPRFGDFTWFKAGADLGRVPTG